jgi:hypothetical protein
LRGQHIPARACHVSLRRHKNVVVHSDLGSTKALLVVA